MYILIEKLLLNFFMTVTKKIPIYFAKIELFYKFETKTNLSTSVFIFSTISQILKIIFYVFWAQTCRNLKSIKFANFLRITCP